MGLLSPGVLCSSSATMYVVLKLINAYITAILRLLLENGGSDDSVIYFEPGKNINSKMW